MPGESRGSGSGDPILDDALMRALVHHDCRGARLGTDDVEALWSLYDDGSACTGDLTLELTGQTVTTAETFDACRTVTAGTGFAVGSTGVVALRAGERVVLSDGFSVEDGGRFTAEVDSVPRCPGAERWCTRLPTHHLPDRSRRPPHLGRDDA